MLLHAALRFHIPELHALPLDFSFCPGMLLIRRNSIYMLLGLNVLENVMDVALMIVPVATLWNAQLKRTAELRVWLVGLWVL